MRIYEMREMTSQNRLSPRSHYIPEGVSEVKLLNGTWDFAYFERDIDVPETIERWDTIPVPACWQLHGYGHPNYTNVNYPYPCDPPFVPDDNPCGVYRRTFEIAKKMGQGLPSFRRGFLLRLRFCKRIGSRFYPRQPLERGI